MKSNRIKKIISNNSGFTLIEMIVAMFIFSIVVTVAAGSILAIINANKKSQSIQSVTSNLNLALEAMVREMRFSSEQIDLSDLKIDGQNCPSGSNYCSVSLVFGDNQVSFGLNSVTGQDYYKISKLSIIDSVQNIQDITDPETIKIKYLNFYGNDGGTDMVLITLGGEIDSEQEKTNFNMQTTVNRRSI